MRETERKYESAQPLGRGADRRAGRGGRRRGALRAHRSRPLGDLLRHRGPAPAAFPHDAAAPPRRPRRGLAPQAARRRGQPRRGPPAAGPPSQATRPARRAQPCRPPGRAAAAGRRAGHGPRGVDADRRPGRGRRDGHRRPGDRPAPRHRRRGAARAWTPSRWSGPRSRSSWPARAPPRCSTGSRRRCCEPGCSGRRRRPSSAGCSPTGSRPRRRGRWPTRTRPRATSCSPTWPSRPRRSGPRTRGPPRRPGRACTPCGWPAAGCAARFQSFRALLDRSRTDDLVVELRWLAGELGGARDLEVQEARISADVAALPPELALGPVAAQTTRFFATRRASAGAAADGRAGQ